MNPQSAKLRFKFRTLNNWLIVVGIFVLVAAVFDSFIADTVAIAVLCYLYFFILDKRPIRFRCNNICKKIILSNTPWVCRACGSTNMDANTYSFLNRCKNEECGVEPKAYRCHHKGCGGMIFFTEDEDDTNYASALNSPAEAPEPDERDTKRQAHEESKEDMEAEIEMAELKEKLRKIREEAKKAKAKKKTKFQEAEEKFREFFNGHMSVEDIADELRAEAARKYKDNPDRLQKAYEVIDAFVREGCL
jgi:hypothetical protein